MTQIAVWKKIAVDHTRFSRSACTAAMLDEPHKMAETDLRLADGILDNTYRFLKPPGKACQELTYFGQTATICLTAEVKQLGERIDRGHRSYLRCLVSIS